MSPRSMGDGAWLATLRPRPRRASVSARLIIEITETAAIADVAPDRRLHGRMSTASARPLRWTISARARPGSGISATSASTWSRSTATSCRGWRLARLPGAGRMPAGGGAAFRHVHDCRVGRGRGRCGLARRAWDRLPAGLSDRPPGGASRRCPTAGRRPGRRGSAPAAMRRAGVSCPSQASRAAPASRPAAP